MIVFFLFHFLRMVGGYGAMKILSANPSKFSFAQFEEVFIHELQEREGRSSP